MGNYADWGDVAGRYPKIASVAGGEELQESFIAGTEAIINSYLAKQFTTPLTGKPPLLTDITIDMVYAKAMVHKDKASETIWERAMAILQNILAGEVLLVDSDGAAVSTLGGAVWSSTEDYFDSFSMLGALYDHVDPDLIDDLKSERDIDNG